MSKIYDYAPREGYYYSIDDASKSGDYSCITVWRKPNRIERFLRYIHMSNAKWELKIVRQELVK